MKKLKFFLLALTGTAMMLLGGCKEKENYDDSAFQEDMKPLTEDELESMDEDSDDEMTEVDEKELDQNQEEDSQSSADTEETQNVKKLDEKGTYTDKNEVSEYIYEYGHIPSNLTAENYDNAEKMLPVEEGVTYQQCSLDAEGKKKIIFTQDGKRVYYTEDDGKSFEEIY